ncbi:molybdopterin adenylyltransferase [Bremerella alba]|uniref:Molybdopterin adenylyltransferase n=1 Tax=Bremerella alba TaxID=980252 RepID=A0A7V8V7N1_9BACT|nr:molybdopterin adenylyltransferase [Bremerella alba]MBA2116186.1 Molybdopterin adenylyltransferase [Bremerella alba]
MPNTPAKIGIVTVSDRAYQGEYEDRGGPAIREYLQQVMASPWEAVAKVIPDEREVLNQTLIGLSDDVGCCLIITTGGTGPAKRDLTPDVTTQVCDKILPGFGELMRKVSLEKVPTAILSRQTAGLRGNSLIINLPGQPKAIAECLDAVFPAIPYCIDLVEGPYLETNPERIEAFRPQKK